MPYVEWAFGGLVDVTGGQFVDDGTIIGEARAVPEPASFGLLLTALGGLAAARRRRRTGLAAISGVLPHASTG